MPKDTFTFRGKATRSCQVIRIGSPIVVVLTCCFLVSCLSVCDPVKPERGSDSLYPEEFNYFRFQYRVADGPQPFVPKPVMIPMTDTHHFEISGIMVE